MSKYLKAYHRDQTTLSHTSSHREGSPSSCQLIGSECFYLYLIDGVVDSWTESTVNTEKTIVYDGCEREIVENISTIAPNIERTVLS